MIVDRPGKTKEETKFRFIAEKSLYYDTQLITIEEKPEFLKGAAQPAKLVVPKRLSHPVLIRLPYFTFLGTRKELDALYQKIKKEEKKIKIDELE